MRRLHLMGMLLLTILLSLVIIMPAAAEQNLPASPWYVVMYQFETDTLHWINQGGEQASIDRPVMPQESDYHDLRISPNGRYMVMTALLNTGNEGIGIYDFEQAQFIQTHEAQPGETIHLGYRHIFSTNSQFVAIGFSSGDFANPAWRIILFETATGNATAFIDQTHPDAPEPVLSMPMIQYLDGIYVHFHLIPQAVGGSSTWPAYKWQAMGFDPESPIISESSYNRASVDILPLTGEVATSYMEEGSPALAPAGPAPNFNAVGRGFPNNGTGFTAVHIDSTHYHFGARWAKGGDWLLFLSSDQALNQTWNALLADGTPGNNSHMPFDPKYKEVFGTSDGYVLLDDTKTLYFTNGFMPNTALNLWQGTPNSGIVYVTPIGVNFALEQIGDGAGDNGIVGADDIAVNNPPAEPIDCSLAPPQRVSIGNTARVMPAAGNLNVRTEPGADVVTIFNGGTAFNVIGGPICHNGLFWWQIQRAAVQGWLAEGDSTEYYIEPYEGGPTDTPTSPGAGGPGDFAANPTATPAILIFIPPVTVQCQGALAPRLTVGESATVTRQILAFSGPSARAFPYVFHVGSQLNVISGPQCANSQLWWSVSGVPIGTNDGQPHGGVYWISEGANGTYNVEP